LGDNRITIKTVFCTSSTGRREVARCIYCMINVINEIFFYKIL
jgi:hypothetical protein